jgi:hypothetical protein
MPPPDQPEPVLYGIYKTNEVPPHILKWLGDKLKVVYSAYSSALYRRAMEAGQLITHGPASQRERSKPEIEGSIPLEIQKAALCDLFGNWAVEYAGGNPSLVEGPPTHPGVVVPAYRSRISRFLTVVSAPIYKNLSNRVKTLLKMDEEIATWLYLLFPSGSFRQEESQG